MSDDCGPARLRGLPLDLLGLAVVQSNKELDKDKEDKEDKEEKELAEEEERRLGTLGWAGTAILAQPPSRPPSPPHPTTPPDFYLFLLPGLFFATFFFVPRFLQPVLFFKLPQLPAALLFLVPHFLSGFFVNIFFNRFLDPVQYAFTFLPALSIS